MSDQPDAHANEAMREIAERAYVAALSDLASELAGRGQQFVGDVRTVALALRESVTERVTLLLASAPAVAPSGERALREFVESVAQDQHEKYSGDPKAPCISLCRVCEANALLAASPSPTERERAAFRAGVIHEWRAAYLVEHGKDPGCEGFAAGNIDDATIDAALAERGTV